MLNKKDFFIYFKTIDKDKKTTKNNTQPREDLRYLKLNILFINYYKSNRTFAIREIAGSQLQMECSCKQTVSSNLIISSLPMWGLCVPITWYTSMSLCSDSRSFIMLCGGEKLLVLNEAQVDFKVYFKIINSNYYIWIQYTK